MNPRRLYAPVVLGTLAAGGLAFFSLSRTWATSRVASEGLPSDVVSVSGSDALPLASALAVVVVTAALAVLAASPRLRRVVGVLTIIVAVVAIWTIATGRGALDDAVADAVSRSPSFTGGTGEPDVDRTAWPLAAIASFVLAAILGVVTAWFGARWPSMGKRYEAPSVRPSAGAPQTDTDMWKAMDEGHDPTQ